MSRLHVVIAPDSFKGSASSTELCLYIRKGICRVVPDALVHSYPLADGGEGTIDALTYALSGTKHHEPVLNAFGQTISAPYALLPDDSVIIEVAATCGLPTSDRTEALALSASSYGIGLQIHNALDRGAKTVIIGLGGSASTDGGAGLLSALGARLLNARGVPICAGLAGLSELATIDLSRMDPRIFTTKIIALCDVSNPLTGPTGSVYTFGPQKGLSKDSLAHFDATLANYATIAEEMTPTGVKDSLGAGAAGGIGFALAAFLAAEMVSGIDYVLNAIGIDRALETADLVICGEGKMDAQTSHGKAPIGVAKRAKQFGVPTIALVGARARNLYEVYEAGMTAVLPCVLGPETLDFALTHVAENVELSAETAMRLFLAQRSSRLVG